MNQSHDMFNMLLQQLVLHGKSVDCCQFTRQNCSVQDGATSREDGGVPSKYFPAVVCV